MNENEIMGKKIKELRLKNGLTQIAMAKKLEITQSYVSKIESGDATPNLMFLKNFRRKFKINLNTLLC